MKAIREWRSARDLAVICEINEARKGQMRRQADASIGRLTRWMPLTMQVF